MARRKNLSTILKEVDEVAHQVDKMAVEFTGEGIFDRAKRAWQRLKQAPATVSTPDPYEILGLNPNCIPSDIVYHYRQLAKKYHPDNRETGDERIFKAITEAYEELCRQRGIK